MLADQQEKIRQPQEQRFAQTPKDSGLRSPSAESFSTLSFSQHTIMSSFGQVIPAALHHDHFIKVGVSHGLFLSLTIRKFAMDCKVSFTRSGLTA